MQHSTPRFFHQIVLPVLALLPDLVLKHHSDYGYRKFFAQQHLLLSLYAHLAKAESVNDLAEQLADPKQPTAQLVGQLRPLAATSLSRANAHRSYLLWQELFALLYPKLSPQFKQLHLGGLSGLNAVRLVDGSLFEALSSMLWASYSSTKNKLKGHFFLDLNGLPDKLIVSAGSASEREVLLAQIEARVTYVFDRGYNSYLLFGQFQTKGAYFVTRLLGNALFHLKQELRLFEPEKGLGLVADQLIALKDETGQVHELRLVTYRTAKGQSYRYLTNRFDLPALAIVRLYLWRWEIETFFAWLKRHLVFNHWYSENENGVRIQLFAGLLTFLLLRLYAATKGQSKLRIKEVRQVRHWLTLPVSSAELLIYEAKLLERFNLSYCFSFAPAPLLLDNFLDSF
ncbi:MAG TPA: IS4 family transposase [Chloroflexia bacterium]|nr:IS4 family transposase [Chloroflexia bacterium]